LIQAFTGGDDPIELVGADEGIDFGYLVADIAAN